MPGPNWFDRVIATVAPEAALRRMHARMRFDDVSNLAARGGFEGARADWRGSSWRSEPSGPNTSLYGDLSRLRQRAHSIARNNPLGKRSIEILTAHAVGCGIVPSWSNQSPAARRRLKSEWDRFVDTVDARRQTTLYGLQDQAVRSMFEGGEALALRQRDRVSGSPALTYLLIEGEQLDHSREGVFEKMETRLGVAFAPGAHRPAGYWLWDRNPSDAILWPQYPTSRLVSAEGILHLYRIRRIGQVRGITELGASLTVLRDLADYKESALMKARIEACFAGFVTSDDSTVGTVATRKSTEGGAERTYGTITPGMLQRLQPGEDVKFGQPSSQSDYSAFSLAASMEAASGIGVTYDQATGDLRQANYSSLRAGKIEFRRLIEIFQNITIIPMFVAPMYREFLAFARDFGSLLPKDENVPVKWITPAWEPIDPVSDLKADIMAMRSGRLSYGDFVASWGQDPFDQLQEIADFNAEIDRLELTLDGDPRKVSVDGRVQAPADAGGEGGNTKEAKRR